MWKRTSAPFENEEKESECWKIENEEGAALSGKRKESSHGGREGRVLKQPTLLSLCVVSSTANAQINHSSFFYPDWAFFHFMLQAQ